MAKTGQVPLVSGAPAALALADLARDNSELQAAISEAGAMKPLIIMLTDFADVEGQKAACSALATLAQGSGANQVIIAKAGGIPPLVELLKHVGSHEEAARAVSMLALERKFMRAPMKDTEAFDTLSHMFGQASPLEHSSVQALHRSCT